MIFKEDFESVFKRWAQEVSYDLSEDVLSSLSESINSPEAEAFTKKMNKLYKDRNTIDEDGNLTIIVTPTNLMARAIPNGDGTYTLHMSLEEDRWFRADQLFGNNIIGKAGFKYTNMNLNQED